MTASKPAGLDTWRRLSPPAIPSLAASSIAIAFLIFLSGCSPKVECDSFETRNAVLKAISNDHTDPLGKYAAENSSPIKSNGSNSKRELKKPLYLLGEKIVTTSTSADKQTLKCSGEISVTVGDAKASKEVDFTVQQTDGKLSVSVTPFQF